MKARVERHENLKAVRARSPIEAGPSVRLKIVYEPSDEGGFTAYVPALPGCISEGTHWKKPGGISGRRSTFTSSRSKTSLSSKAWSLKELAF